MKNKSHRWAVVIAIMHNTISFMIYWALFRAYTNNPGYVPRSLKFKRPKLFEQTIDRMYEDEKNIDDILSSSYSSNRRQNDSHNTSADIESQSFIKSKQVPARPKSRSEKRMYKRLKKLAGKTTFTYCKKCDNISPPRAEHCDFWDVCVLRMDHHWPWVGNCVGFGNHKNFALFIFYLFIGGLFDGSWYTYGWALGLYPKFKVSSIPIAIAVCTGMTVMVSFSIGFMLIVVVLSIVRNYTIDEVMDSGGIWAEHPFDQSLYQNIAEVMGDNWLYWLIPQREVGRSHNGIDYKMKLPKSDA